MNSPVIVRYYVKRGDTLNNIANTFGSDVSTIIQINGLNTDILRVGQELLVPTTKEITNFSLVPNVTLYRVRVGDNLWAIARNFGTTVSELKNANNLQNDIIYVGQQLLVPIIQPLSPSPGTDYYIVKRGDTLWAIANKYGTSVNDLKNLNNLTSDILTTGQILAVPIKQ